MGGWSGHSRQGHRRGQAGGEEAGRDGGGEEGEAAGATGAVIAGAEAAVGRGRGGADSQAGEKFWARKHTLPEAGTTVRRATASAMAATASCEQR